MKLWVPAAVGGLILAVYFVFYTIGATESQGSASLGFANAFGLFAVLVGLVVAGVIIRRGAPPSGSQDPRNP